MHCLRSVAVLSRAKLPVSVNSSLFSPFSSHQSSTSLRLLSRYSRTFLTYQRRAYSSTGGATMTAQKQAIISHRVNNIIKSAEDKREYRGLELKNGLRVLLISDPTADKSAASMDVNVGHLMDPWELPGLAHFCEHMLFLGTAKYPSENEYSKYISSHGGITNAFTGSDHTNYHFDIAPDHLPGALDRFVQFFLCPQFTESATEREVCAVDSENSNNLQNDQWRMIQLERSLSKPGHDYGKFGTGSKKTLLEDAREKGIEPREALLKFHQRYYSSDIMSCCIIGTESLDELENLVVSLNFGDIVAKNVERKVWQEGPYDRDQLGVKIELVPVKDLRYLTLMFPMKDYKDEYRAQPAHYISHLIGHEGPGSLLSELKRLGWVSSLSAGGRLIANGFGVFNISVDLSEEGLKHTDDIIRLIFNEIGLVKSNGPLRWIHDELKQLVETKFRFKDKEAPMNYVTQLSSELQRIGFEDVVCADYKMDQFKPDLISEILDALTPENMMYAVVSQEFANQEGNVREKWYQTEYKKTRVDQKSLKEWRSAMDMVPSCLQLPEKNEYIANRFDLKPREESASVAPRLIKDDQWSRIWFMQDDEFKLPKSSTRVAIHSPMMAADPMNTFLSAMYIICLQDAIAEETYNAYLAGLSSAFDIQPWGISLRVSGYDEKQHLFARDLVRRLVNFTPDVGRYEVLKENLCRNLRNFRQTQPYLQTHYYSGLLLSSRQWSKEQVLACAEVCDVERLNQFIREALQAIHVEALVYGNNTKEEALKVIDGIVAELKTVPKVRPLFTCELHQNREHQIPKGQSFVYKGCQSTHPNASINFIMQTGPQNTRENVLLELIVQLAAEPAFNQLRTNEQLGYIVHTGTRRSCGTQAFEMLVQGKHDPEHMNSRIENFLQTFRKNLEEMPDEEFKDNVEALAAKRLEKPKTMGAKSARYWAEIDVGFYHFNREKVEVPELRKLTKKDVIKFFDRHFSCDSPARRKLTTMIYANDTTEEMLDQANKRVERSAAGGDAAGDSAEKKEPKRIMNIDSFKSALSLYPLPQPVIEIPPLASKNDETLPN